MPLDKILLLAVAVFLLISLLTFRYREIKIGVIVTKTILSSLFVFAALRYPSPMSWFHWWIVGSLMLCFLGDIMLALSSSLAFRLGLGLFLIGHLVYSLAFFSIAKVDVRLLVGIVPIVFLGTAVYRLLKPHLGSMHLPVAAYLICISVMLVAALAVLLSSRWSLKGRWMLFGGAVFFYLSDYLVARNRFVNGRFVNRLIGLPLYYTAQFSIALSQTEL